MNKIAYIIILVTLSNISQAKTHHKHIASPAPAVIQAQINYEAGNTSKLEQIAKKNKSPIISFYLGQLYLKNKQIDNAIQITNNLPANTYLQTSMQKGILSYYYQQNYWSQYLSQYKIINGSQLSENERCGYDLAMMSIDSTYEIQSNLKHQINNKIKPWCMDTVLALYKANKLELNDINIMLYNLIIDNNLTSFNVVADKIGIPKQDFTSTNDRNVSSYKIIYIITQNIKLNPAEGLNILQTYASQVDGMTRQFIYNYLMMRLGTKQLFNQSLSLINSTNQNYFSDDMFEWRNRIYLASKQWKNVIHSIESSPPELKNKPVWQYWLAYSQEKLGNIQSAKKIVANMPQDYSYYSLLAYSRYSESIVPKQAAVKGSNINKIKYSNSVKISLDSYKMSVKYNNNSLKNLATNEWSYASKMSSDKDLITMSRVAQKLQWNDMSIYSATLVHKPILELIYPILYNEYYSKYSNSYGLDNSYPLAITRQESRFNKRVIAYDGGVGLMQIMPQTAKFIAQKTNSKNCYTEYSCNIKFGAWYLSSLSKKFGNNIIYSTAAYNAGPRRAHDWAISFAKLDAPLQIELIPFNITRNYVKQVLANKIIYEAQLESKVPANMYSYISKFNTESIIYVDDNESTDSNKQ